VKIARKSSNLSQVEDVSAVVLVSLNFNAKYTELFKGSVISMSSTECLRCALWFRQECPYAEVNPKPNSCDKFVMYKALEELRKVFHKWFYYEDESLLDLCLAVKIHSLQFDRFAIPLWLIIIGASGDRKSSTVMSFYDGKNEDGSDNSIAETYLLNYMTKNTLASGSKKDVKKDLTPMLDRKLVLSLDSAQFLKMHADQRGEIWAQLREAYDGRVQKATGSGVHTFYEGMRWNWLLCATPTLDQDLLLKDELGTRELIYRMPKENEDSENLKKMQSAVVEGIDLVEQRDKELTEAVQNYLVWYRKQTFNVEVSEEVTNRLMQYAVFVSQLRVSAECDSKTGDLTNFVYPEKPTRITQQLFMLFLCLKQLSHDYSDETALARIFEVVKSSIHPIRLKILTTLLENEPISTTKLAHKVGLHYATTNRELQICKHLGLASYEEIEQNNKITFMWKTNPLHEIVLLIKKISSKGDSNAL